MMKQGRNGEGGESLVTNQRFKNPQQFSFEGTLYVGFGFLFQPLSPINHHHLSQNLMQYQEEGSTWKIHARSEQLGEISSKFRLWIVCAMLRIQCSTCSQCTVPI